MNILIVGKSGVGKSNMGDMVKNTIFKLDSNAKIESDDPDRAVKTFGSGSNVYNIGIRKLENGEPLSEVFGEILPSNDVIILINNKSFQEWFRTVYNK